jgi:hypothetical protein
VRALRFLLHVYAYLFHLVLALFLLGMAVVAWLARSSNFSLGMIPWYSGASLVRFLVITSLVGVLAVGLAASGRFRPLFALWTLFVLGMVVWGFFIGPYSYAGFEEFQTALWMLAGAVVAAAGGLSQLRPVKS